MVFGWSSIGRQTKQADRREFHKQRKGGREGIVQQCAFREDATVKGVRNAEEDVAIHRNRMTRAKMARKS